MPRFPAVTPSVSAMRGGVFSRLAHRIAAIEGERYPLHVGDTWMEPPVGARMQDLTVEDHPGMHRYAAPHGHPALLSAIATRRGVAPERVLVSAGATGGLSAAAGALLSPGDEVLLLAPYWPLIRGIVQAARGVAVDVPFFGEEGGVAALLDRHRTDRTVAVYVNSPNNPTGALLDAAALCAVADYARAHGLWVLSDEVYEDYAYTGPHVPLAGFAPERTFTAYSFSKAFGMAGNRCGYLVGPDDPAVMLEVRKISTHSFYAAPTAAQLAAAAVLERGGDWLAAARAQYQAAGDAAADRLGLPRPGGGTFLWLDVGAHLDDRGLHGFLEDCVDRRLVLAPGPSFGPYPSHVRVCFTSAPPEVVARGVDALAGLIGR